jgi:hypothetical protein
MHVRTDSYSMGGLVGLGRFGWVGLCSLHQRVSVQSTCGSAVVACDGRAVRSSSVAFGARMCAAKRIASHICVSMHPQRKRERRHVTVSACAKPPYSVCTPCYIMTVLPSAVILLWSSCHHLVRLCLLTRSRQL